MALQKTNASIVAIKEEVTFKDPVTFAASDVVSFTKFSMKPNLETISRDYINSTSLLKGKPLAGKSTSSGDITLELVPDATDSQKFAGHVLYDVGLGKWTANGAVIGTSNIADHISATDGDAGVYYFSTASDPLRSLGVKYVIGGLDANSVDIRGVLISSLKINMPSQGIVTVDHTLEGSTGFIPVNSNSGFAEVCSSMTPFVARDMTVQVAGSDICASDLTFDITNTTQDFVCVTDSGVGQKIVTEREIKGSFKLAFENLDQINAFNSSTDMSIFAKATSLDGKEMAIWVPVATRTSLDVSDDSGTIIQNVEFSVSDDCGGSAVQPIMIAAK